MKVISRKAKLLYPILSAKDRGIISVFYLFYNHSDSMKSSNLFCDFWIKIIKGLLLSSQAGKISSGFASDFWINMIRGNNPRRSRGILPKEGLEPSRMLSPTDFETVASASSATSARWEHSMGFNLQINDGKPKRSFLQRLNCDKKVCQF